MIDSNWGIDIPCHPWTVPSKTMKVSNICWKGLGILGYTPSLHFRHAELHIALSSPSRKWWWGQKPPVELTLFWTVLRDLPRDQLWRRENWTVAIERAWTPESLQSSGGPADSLLAFATIEGTMLVLANMVWPILGLSLDTEPSTEIGQWGTTEDEHKPLHSASPGKEHLLPLLWDLDVSWRIGATDVKSCCK